MWLTVSLPYTMGPSTGTCSTMEDCHPQNPSKAGDQKPWNDMAEEKAAEGSNSPSEEYLHDHHSGPEAGSLGRKTYLSDRGDSPRIPYHGELLVPPPNAL